MILGGDNVDSEHLDKDTNLNNLNQITNTFLFGPCTDRFILRGNHDAGTIQHYNSSGKVELKKIIGRNDFKNIFQTKKLFFNEIRDGDSLYFYKDYPDKKIRVICVDTIDYPEIINKDGGLKYFDQWDYGFQEKQLKWVAEEALGKCPIDFHVIMFSHVPLNNTKSVNRENRRNFDCMKQIISGFVKKQLVIVRSNLKDFEVDFEVDFSKKEKTCFAAVISGHEHWDNDIDMGDYRSIVINRAWPNDVLFSENEDAFAAIEIDTSMKIINIKGFGRVFDREIKYS